MTGCRVRSSLSDGSRLPHPITPVDPHSRRIQSQIAKLSQSNNHQNNHLMRCDIDLAAMLKPPRPGDGIYFATLIGILDFGPDGASRLFGTSGR